jgi:biotin carboxyl carrier protein
MSEQERLRLTVAGPEDLVIELGEEDLEPADRSLPPVRGLPASAVDRVTGRSRFEVDIDGWVFQVTAVSASRAALIERASLGGVTAGGPQVKTSVRAQIPGRVVRLWVAQGDQVEKGQRLLAIEAMKMENEVRSPRAGTVSRVAVAVSAAVELGDELVVVG